MKWLGATASFEDRIEGMHEDFGLFTDRGSYWAAIARRRIELSGYELVGQCTATYKSLGCPQECP
ncbi:hypothetical protein PCAR4_550022 [Paraburkholderia caribensis]|nr:hypothetical protein PCAR4_550022 [Paraburkholderia caribensis]